MSALNHIHYWSKIQSEIGARWLGMVVESRARQKKLENQLKLEAKIHEFEVPDGAILPIEISCYMIMIIVV